MENALEIIRTPLGPCNGHEKDSNDSSAALHLSIPTSKNGQPLPPGSYIGPRFFGFLWRKNQAKPLGTNIFRKTGIVPASDETGPIKPSTKSSPFSAFETYIMEPSGKYKHRGTLAVAAFGLDAKITFNNRDIQKLHLLGRHCLLVRKSRKSNQLLNLVLSQRHRDQSQSLPGLQFSG